MWRGAYRLSYPGQRLSAAHDASRPLVALLLGAGGLMTSEWQALELNPGFPVLSGTPW